MIGSLPPVTAAYKKTVKSKASRDFTNPLTWYNSRSSTIIKDKIASFHQLKKEQNKSLGFIDPSQVFESNNSLSRDTKPKARPLFSSKIKQKKKSGSENSSSDFDSKILKQVKAAQRLNNHQTARVFFNSPETSLYDASSTVPTSENLLPASMPLSSESSKPEIYKDWLDKINVDSEQPDFSKHLKSEVQQTKDNEIHGIKQISLPELRPRPRLKTALKEVRKPRNNKDKLIPEAIDREEYIKKMQSDLMIRFRHKERDCKLLSGTFHYNAPPPPKPKPPAVRFDLHVDLFPLDRYETLSFFRGSQSNTVVTMHTPRRKKQFIEQITEESGNPATICLCIDASRLEQSQETRRTECLPGSAFTRALMDNKGWYNRSERKHVYGSTDDIYGSARSLALHSSHASVLQISPPVVQHSSRAPLITMLRTIDTPREETSKIDEKDNKREEIPDSVDGTADKASTVTSLLATPGDDNLHGGTTLPKHVMNTPENSFLREVALAPKPPSQRNKTIVLPSGQHVTFIPRRQVEVFGERKAHTFHAESKAEGRDGLMLMPVSRDTAVTYSLSVATTNPLIKLDLNTPATASSRKLPTQSSEKRSRRRKNKRPPWSGSDERVAVDASSYLESCRDCDPAPLVVATPETNVLRQESEDDRKRQKQAEVAEWQQMVAEREKTQTSLNTNTEYDPQTGTHRPTASLAPIPPMSRGQLSSRPTTQGAELRPVTHKTDVTSASYTGTGTAWPSEVDEEELLRHAEEQDAAVQREKYGPRSVDEDSVTVVSTNLAARSLAATVGTDHNATANRITEDSERHDPVENEQVGTNSEDKDS